MKSDSYTGGPGAGHQQEQNRCSSQLGSALKSSLGLGNECSLTDEEVEGPEARTPFHTVQHLGRRHRHCRSPNPQKDNLEVTRGPGEPSSLPRGPCAPPPLCLRWAGQGILSSVESLSKGQPKGWSQQEVGTSFSQRLQGLEQGFSKCGPWTRRISTP